MTIAPKTRSNEISTSLHEKLQVADGFLDPLAWDVAVIRRSIREVEDHDWADAENLWAQYYAAVNDNESLLAGYAAMRNRPTSSITRSNYAKSLADLGHHEEATELILPLAKATSGQFTRIAGIALQLGLVKLVADEANRAREMDMDLSPAGNAIDAANVLHKCFENTGVSEELYRSHLRLLAEVFREFGKKPGPFSYQGNAENKFGLGVIIQCRVNAVASELWQMNLRLAELIVDRDIQVHPGFSVGFARDTRREQHS